MRTRLLVAAFLMATAASSPALAQQAQGKGGTSTDARQAQEKGGIATETQQRIAHRDDPLPWDLLGLFGLLGLLGLSTRHPDDSYHPSNLD